MSKRDKMTWLVLMLAVNVGAQVVYNKLKAKYPKTLA